MLEKISLNLLRTKKMYPKNKVSVIILAAGISQRFNGNKLLVEIDGVPLVRKTVEIYLKTDPYEIFVIVGHEQEKIKSALKGLNVKFVFNENFNCTPGSKIAVKETRAHRLPHCPLDRTRP